MLHGIYIKHVSFVKFLKIRFHWELWFPSRCLNLVIFESPFPKFNYISMYLSRQIGICFLNATEDLGASVSHMFSNGEHAFNFCCKDYLLLIHASKNYLAYASCEIIAAIAVILTCTASFGLSDTLLYGNKFPASLVFLFFWQVITLANQLNLLLFVSPKTKLIAIMSRIRWFYEPWHLLN